MLDERILVAVDDSAASERAVEYVAEMVRGRPGHYVHLVHVLHGGEDTAAARALLERLRGRLQAVGLAEDRVDSGALSVRPDVSMVEGLLDTARDRSCGTIVMGRNSLPRHRELLHRHPADELVRAAGGFTLWIVE
jgi:K+-sensing histidine kinase KdpD